MKHLALIALLLTACSPADGLDCVDWQQECGADTDEDGIPDVWDTCPRGVTSGTDCGDTDHDTVANADDNCPDYPNSRQIDSDGDGYGDMCDSLPGVVNPVGAAVWILSENGGFACSGADWVQLRTRADGTQEAICEWLCHSAPDGAVQAEHIKVYLIGGLWWTVEEISRRAPECE